MSNGEILYLHVGSAGVKLAPTLWRTLHAERLNNPEFNTNCFSNTKRETSNFSAEGLENNSEDTEELCSPRAVLVDTAPDYIDRIRKHNEEEFKFDTRNLISWKEDCADIYSRGHYTLGREVTDQAIEAMRREVEKCDCLQGIYMLRSICGGTGAGVGNTLIDRLRVEFCGKEVLATVNIMPSAYRESGSMCHINALMGLEEANAESDFALMIQNRALYAKIKGYQDDDEERINQLIADYMLHLNYSTNECAQSLDKIRTNLVSSPQLNLCQISKSEQTQTSEDTNQSIETLKDSFKTTNYYTEIPEKKKGKYFATHVRYFGNGISQLETTIAVNKLRESKHFESALSDDSPLVKIDHYESKSSLDVCYNTFNSESVVHLLKGLMKQFDILHNQRAFIHWFYGEGESEGELSEARYNLESVKTSYEDFEEN